MYVPHLLIVGVRRKLGMFEVWGLRVAWVHLSNFTKFSFSVYVVVHQFSSTFIAPFLCHNFLYILRVCVWCWTVRRFKVRNSKSKITKGFSILHWGLSFAFYSHYVYAFMFLKSTLHSTSCVRPLFVYACMFSILFYIIHFMFVHFVILHVPMHFLFAQVCFTILWICVFQFSKYILHFTLVFLSMHCGVNVFQLCTHLCFLIL
jgi:hypothetical protein